MRGDTRLSKASLSLDGWPGDETSEVLRAVKGGVGRNGEASIVSSTGGGKAPGRILYSQG
jgi:hypothetical protein